MKIVSIVGRSAGFEKYLNAEGSIWCVSSVFKQMIQEKVDLIFQLHNPESFEDWILTEHKRVIAAFPGPFRQYPVKHMLKKYGPVFGSSISWMLALAIEEGYKRINIFGCDMASQIEYIYQRDTFFYMIGRAEAIGIEIVIPEDSRTFFKDRIYGVCNE